MVPLPPGSVWLFLSNQVSSIAKRAIGAFDMFFTAIVVMTRSLSRLVVALVKSTSAAPLMGGVNFLPARTDVIGGAWGCVCAKERPPTRLVPTSAAAKAER